MSFPIKCGKCECEYFPRYEYGAPSKLNGLKHEGTVAVDSSCPQCGAGREQAKIIKKESVQRKKLLHG